MGENDAPQNNGHSDHNSWSLCPYFWGDDVKSDALKCDQKSWSQMEHFPDSQMLPVNNWVGQTQASNGHWLYLNAIRFVLQHSEILSTL